MFEISVNNLTENEIDGGWVKKIIGAVLEGEKAEKRGELSVAFIGPGRMRKLNYTYRKKNKVTDVLAFPELTVPFEKFRIGKAIKSAGLGEIVVCPREIKKNAKRFNTSFEEEFARVIIHGVLHLLGYDHEKAEADAEKMKEKEDYYLEKSKES